jgi:hypothetical protein
MSSVNENQAGDKDYGIYKSDVPNSEYRIKSHWGKEFFDDFSLYGEAGPSFEDIERRIEAYSNQTTDQFSQEELDDLNHFRAMAGLAELDNHKDDKQNNETINDQKNVYSKFLRNQVRGNILDGYYTPQYVFTLYMLKRNKLAEYQQQTGSRDGAGKDTGDSDEAREDTPNESTFVKNRTLIKPNPQDYVIIAQTGTTDIGIDDVTIQTFNGLDSDVIPLKIDFKLTEPGSISLLDRIAEAKRYCGYNKPISTIPGLFLQLEFAGYPDASAHDGVPIDSEVDGKPERIPLGFPSDAEGNASKVPTEMYFELGGVTYDMEINAEGATYNFSAYRQKTGGRDRLHTRTAHTIKGRNLSELLGGLHPVQPGSSKDNTPDNAQDPDSGSAGDEVTDSGSDATAPAEEWYGLEYAFNKDFEDLSDDIDKKTDEEFKLFLDGFISNYAVKEGDPVKMTSDTISDALLKDFTLLETFAKSGSITKEVDGELVLNWQANTVQQSVEDDARRGPKIIEYDVSREINDSISVNGARGDITITEEVEKTIDGKAVYSDPLISITIPPSTHIKDCIYLVLSLSEDFVNRAIRVKPGGYGKEDVKTVDSAYSRWLTLDTDHYVDFSDQSWDEKKGSYDEYFHVRPVLSYTSNPNMIVFEEEYEKIKNPTLKEISTLLDSMSIQKEYYYSYTGLNTQILDLSLTFDEAYALNIPAFGFGDYAQQSGVATASALKEEENAQNTNDSEGVNDIINKDKKAGGIFETLKGLSDVEFEKFAEFAGYSSEDISRLVQEKNYVNEFGSVRGTTNIEDQEYLKEFASGLAMDDIGDAVLSGYTRTTANSEDPVPTETTELIADLSNDLTVVSPYIYASALVMGLEGNDMAAEFYKSLDNEQLGEEFQNVIKPKLETVEVSNIVESAPEERNSIRSTTMSHLMRQYTNAASLQMMDLSVRGDPYWLGNDVFYDINKESDGQPDFTKKTQDIFFVMEAPRKLDFDIEDEDNNTGLFDYGSINYTLSGVYLVYRCTSNFSGGLFTQELNMAQNKLYEFSKIETIKKTGTQNLEDIENYKAQKAWNESNAEKYKALEEQRSGTPTE